MVIRDKKASNIKLTIPQKIDPKKINERVNKKVFILSILLKKIGDCKI